MADINMFMMTGTLTADPIVRMTNKGDKVSTVRFAVDDEYNKEEKKRESQFFEAVAFGNMAEIVAKYWLKGGKITITGRLRKKEFTTNSGVKKINTDLIISQGIYSPSKKALLADTSGSSRAYGNNAPAEVPSNGDKGFDSSKPRQTAVEPAPEMVDDDLPF